MALCLVPFNQRWSDTSTKLDLRAFYRKGDRIAELPVRRHNDWTAGGFVYITLATAKDVVDVRDELRNQGVNMDDLQKSYNTIGNFRLDTYLAEQRQNDADYLSDLQSKVDKFGADAVTEMMRVQDSSFVMPAGVVSKKFKKADTVA